MILLDTNLVSEAMKPEGNPGVETWLNKQPAETMSLSTTSLSELLAGLEVLPAGRCKVNMSRVLDGVLSRLFDRRILPFDQASATSFASLLARAESNGYTISIADCQIAAIATVHSCAVATRDVAPFRAAGVPVLNPWNEEA